MLIQIDITEQISGKGNKHTICWINVNEAESRGRMEYGSGILKSVNQRIPPTSNPGTPKVAIRRNARNIQHINGI